jgi:hypothetical protein
MNRQCIQDIYGEFIEVVKAQVADCIPSKLVNFRLQRPKLHYPLGQKSSSEAQ